MGVGGIRAAQRPSPDLVVEDVSHCGKEQAEPNRLPAKAGGAVPEQVHLLLLDPIPPLSAGAVEVLVESADVRVVDAGHNEARVQSLRAVAAAGEHLPPAMPSLRRVEPRGASLFFRRCAGTPPAPSPFRKHSKMPVLRQSDDMVDPVAFASGKNPRAPEPAIHPGHDPHPQPRLPQPTRQQLGTAGA